MLLLFTEINTYTAKQMSVVLFKRRTSKSTRRAPPLSSTALSDEERISSPYQDNEQSRIQAEVEETIDDTTHRMAHTLSWQHLRYDIPVGRGQRKKLVDDVSGYVTPGKLTALMGESGAGKVISLSSL